MYLITTLTLMLLKLEFTCDMNMKTKFLSEILKISTCNFTKKFKIIATFETQINEFIKNPTEE
jgi:hypothetical protein